MVNLYSLSSATTNTTGSGVAAPAPALPHTNNTTIGDVSTNDENTTTTAAATAATDATTNVDITGIEYQQRESQPYTMSTTDYPNTIPQPNPYNPNADGVDSQQQEQQEPQLESPSQPTSDYHNTIPHNSNNDNSVAFDSNFIPSTTSYNTDRESQPYNISSSTYPDSIPQPNPEHPFEVENTTGTSYNTGTANNINQQPIFDRSRPGGIFDKKFDKISATTSPSFDHDVGDNKNDTKLNDDDNVFGTFTKLYDPFAAPAAQRSKRNDTDNDDDNFTTARSVSNPPRGPNGDIIDTNPYAMVTRPSSPLLDEKEKKINDDNQYQDYDIDYDGYDGLTPEDMQALTVYQPPPEEEFIDDDNEEDNLYYDDPNDAEKDGLSKDVTEIDGKKKRRRRRRIFRKDPNEDSEQFKKRRKCIWACFCIFCWLLIVLIIWLILRGDPEQEEELPINNDDDETLNYTDLNDPFDDMFVVRQPFLNKTTTPFDPYIKKDCDFDSLPNPHIMSQCQCQMKATTIANDTIELYWQVREEISNYFYNGTYDEPITSCSPRNQAMLWLSSGNTRDAGDFYYRYMGALSFISLNGTNWDMQNLWLSDESECNWVGLQCNHNMGVNSIGLDAIHVKGSIPTELQHMGTLRSFSITRNHITGSIPPELFFLPQLQQFVAYTNSITGIIPPTIGYATNLHSFQVENNRMLGMLVSEIGQATSLRTLTLGFNKFKRTIPTEIGYLTNLKHISLEENSFSGTIPTEMGMLSNLETIKMSKNLMYGPIPSEFVSMTNLTSFDAAHTGIGEHFPTALGYSLSKLERLELGSNNFVGTIMTEFGLMTKLAFLSLSKNEFKGNLPTELGLMRNMTRFIVTENFLEGSIPSELGLWTNLHDLKLDGNEFTGVAPLEVCDLRTSTLKLFVVDCPSIRNSEAGVNCTCCTDCRRGIGT